MLLLPAVTLPLSRPPHYCLKISISYPSQLYTPATPCPQKPKAAPNQPISLSPHPLHLVLESKGNPIHPHLLIIRALITLSLSAFSTRAQLVENARLGRHYVASRAIEAGEIVIREEQPLVQGPQQETLPVCLGCSTPLQPGKAKPCEQCGWPLCAACVKHGPECDFTKRYRESKVLLHVR